MRSTAAIANFLAYYFEMIFDNVRVITSGSQTETFEQIFRITDKDVMIGISFPRYSSMSVEAMDFARSRGAHAIAITDSMVSPLVRVPIPCLLQEAICASIVDSLVRPFKPYGRTLIVATVLKKKRGRSSDHICQLELVWNRDGVSHNRDRETIHSTVNRAGFVSKVSCHAYQSKTLKPYKPECTDKTHKKPAFICISDKAHKNLK